MYAALSCYCIPVQYNLYKCSSRDMLTKPLCWQPSLYAANLTSAQYYLYNWSCRDMRPSEVGLVLL